MTDYIKNLDLNNNSVIEDRDVTSVYSIVSLDVDQVDGRILVTEQENNSVTIYPQSPALPIYSPIRLNLFSKFGRLSSPSDAKFDYVRRKIWIADTGNNRVLKVDINSETVDTAINDIIYPHSLAAEVNTGGVFVKAYTDTGKRTGIISYIGSNGLELLNFKFQNDSEGSSSSSSSSSGLDIVSSSSSSEEAFDLPAVYTMAYDHVRYRLWWLNENKIYMADIKNKQVQTYNLGSSYTRAISVDIDLETGNAFVVAQDSDFQEFFILQMSKDNNVILGRGYVPE